jgi:hypothetical protein
MVKENFLYLTMEDAFTIASDPSEIFKTT